MAKGLTSAYVPLGAVGMSPADRRVFEDRRLLRRAHLQRHPSRCAAALATIGVYEEDDLIEHARSMGELMAAITGELEGQATRRSATSATSGCSASSSW